MKEWYRIHVRIGEGSGARDATREIAEDDDKQALESYAKLERQAEDDRRNGRPVTYPLRLEKIVVREVTVDLTPVGAGYEAMDE